MTNDLLTNDPMTNYSVRRLFTGLAMAAFTACMLTVSKAISMAIHAAIANNHQSILIRYAKF